MLSIYVINQKLHNVHRYSITIELIKVLFWLKSSFQKKYDKLNIMDKPKDLTLRSECKKLNGRVQITGPKIERQNRRCRYPGLCHIRFLNVRPATNYIIAFLDIIFCTLRNNCVHLILNSLRGQLFTF